MKINKILILFIVIGGILAAGYFVKSMSNTSAINTTNPVKVTPVITPVVIVTEKIFNGGQGEALISIGEYNDNLTVFVDDINSGPVSNGVPLSLVLPEGGHTIKVCSGTFCESTGQNIQSSIKTTVDFEQRLLENHPEGTLKVSIGDYNAKLTVFIDNSTRGNVSSVKPFIKPIGPGFHTVKICPTNTCFSQSAEITPSNQTSIDFGPQLKSEVKQTDLTVTIGGYRANLPVQIDNVNVGFVSYEKALTIRTSEGSHEIKVCSGVVCEKQTIDLKFGKPSNIDFGEQLKKDAPYPDPTVLISSYAANGNDMNIDVLFINPTTRDLTMTATISTAYTFLDYTSSVRNGAARTSMVTTNVTAGESVTQYAYQYLSGGDSTSASAPVVVSFTVK